MTLAKFFAALNPKLRGTKNLHDYFLSRNLDLDSFVMLSSLAGINGNSSQSSYAAGNTFQDALAHHRVAIGLPALSIDVGLVIDAGWVTENEHRVGAGVEIMRAQNITTKHLLRLIEHNILNSTEDRPHRVRVSPQVPIGILDNLAWDARHSHIAASQSRSPAQQLSAKEQVSPADRLVAAGTNKDLLQTVILESFSQKLSRLLDLPVEDIHHNDSLSGHGVDSVVAVEIRNWLRKEAGANVLMSEDLNGQKTIEQMVQSIVIGKMKS